MKIETNTANVLRFIRAFVESYRHTDATFGVSVIRVGGSRPEYMSVAGAGSAAGLSVELEFSLRRYYLSTVASLYTYEVFATMPSGHRVSREIPIHLED